MSENILEVTDAGGVGHQYGMGLGRDQLLPDMLGRIEVDGIEEVVRQKNEKALSEAKLHAKMASFLERQARELKQNEGSGKTFDTARTLLENEIKERVSSMSTEAFIESTQQPVRTEGIRFTDRDFSELKLNETVCLLRVLESAKKYVMEERDGEGRQTMSLGDYETGFRLVNSVYTQAVEKIENRISEQKK